MSHAPRRRLREAIEAGGPVVAPLCLDPLTARMVAGLGFEAGYLSGGALGYQLALSEALLTVGELATVCRQMTVRADLPIIVDGGVGFGDPVHVMRAMWEFEAAGAAAVELEDQVAPKRVSHHRGVEHLVGTGEMVAKIRYAVEARSDPDFLIIARTGAVHNESFESALERLAAYREAGADLLLLLPETPEQWREAGERLDAPLVAMTSVDARPPAEWAAIGYPVVVDPFTGQVLAFDVVRSAYRRFQAEGSTGHDRREVFGVYRELASAAGLDELYDVERATTEPGT